MLERPATSGKSGELKGQLARTNWILVVDDNELLRASTRSTLEKAGYRVYFAENCDEAVECCKLAQESGYPFDSVILSRNIQGGEETIEKMLEIDPGAKIIVKQGDFDDTDMAAI